MRKQSSGSKVPAGAVNRSFVGSMLSPNHLAVLALIFCLPVGAMAQSNWKNTQGKADSALRGSGRVNASTLGMEIEVPLGGYPGRGIGVPITLRYSSKLWRLAPYTKYPIAGEDNYRTLTRAKYSENTASGWSVSTSAPYIEYTGEADFYKNGTGDPICLFCIEDEGPWDGNRVTVIRRLTFRGADGGSNELRAVDASRVINRSNIVYDWLGTFYAVGGSKLRYTETANSFIMQMPDGSSYTFGAREARTSGGDAVRRALSYTDTNGNTVYYHVPNTVFPNGYITDTMGRNISNVIPAEAPDVPSIQEHTMPGMVMPYKLYWKKLKDTTAEASALTDFSEVLRYTGSSKCNYPNPLGTTPSLFVNNEGNVMVCSVAAHNPVLLTKIELPNGQTYRFTYNVFGEIERIYYPTGSEERFEYDKVAPVSPTYTVYDQVNRGVTKRQVFETAGTETPVEWTYSVVNGIYPPTGGPYTLTVANPDGTKNQRFLHRTIPTDDNGKYGYDSTLDGMAFEERTLNASGQLIRRKITNWQETTQPVEPRWTRPAYRHPRVASDLNYIYEANVTSGLMSSVSYEYDGDLNAPDCPLNVKRVTERGFEAVSASPPAPNENQQINPSNAAPVKISETHYLNTRFSVPQSTRDAYYSRNVLSLPVANRIRNGANLIVAQTETVYDEANYSPEIGRANATTARVWNNTDNSWIETRAKFDIYGNLIETTDAKGNVSQTQYTDNFSDGNNRNANAFPTKTISPIPGGNSSATPFETTVKYDFTTGLPVSTTDANGQTSTVEYNDALLRPTRVIAPNGHQTITEYGAGTSAASRFAKVKTQIDETKWKEAISWYDGLGRTIKTQSIDSNGDVFSETLFDSIGRVWKTTNPYRTGETVYWTENFYDTAGRLFKVKTPDNAEVETAYGLAATGSQIGTVVTVSDQAEKQRRSITNALGQLTRVDEPNGAGQLGAIDNPNQPTFYSYDTLNNLTTVNQGVQTRSFTYNSLSRLLSATNPESGLIQYVYDNNGNLTKKTDARSIETNYTYDALNRVIERTYANEPKGQETPDVTYNYDNLPNAKGKLTKVSSSVSTTEYTAFGILGRVLSHEQTTDGQNYTTGYAYNLSGALIEETYPSGRVVKNVLDIDGDLSLVQSKKNQNFGYHAYASSFTYTAAGAVGSMQLGNGKWESTQFNSRLQPTQIALGTVQSGTDKLKLDYSYGTTTNNGNVQSQTIGVPTVGTNQGFTATQTYTYDSLNRLKDAKEMIGTTEAWKQTFVYDRYGNRNFDTTNNNTTTLPPGCPVNLCNPTVNPANNRLNGYSFDNTGNTTTDAENRTFIYDADDKQIEVRDKRDNIIGQYAYNGDGKRVRKIVPNGETVIFVYDAGGKLMAEYANQVSEKFQVSYVTSDHLGSPRINTDAAAGIVTARHDYGPFGEEIFGTEGRTVGLGYGVDDVRKKFTGYERDNEADLDFAEARYYHPSHGRFTSPDDFKNDSDKNQPQSMNKYVYVRNNPLTWIDPDGKLGMPSTHIDETGKVVAVIDDGDTSVYQHKNNADGKAPTEYMITKRHEKQGTSAGGTRVGATQYLDEFVSPETGRPYTKASSAYYLYNLLRNLRGCLVIRPPDSTGAIV